LQVKGEAASICVLFTIGKGGFLIDEGTQPMHGLRVATKTISIEVDAYDLLKGEKQSERESFSQVVRRLTSERPALTAGELEAAMKPFIGKGAGKKRAAA